MRRSTVLLLALAAVLTLGVYVGSFLLSTTDDRVDQLDTAAVRDAAAGACTDLRVDVDALPALPPSAGAEQRRERVAEQDRLVRRLVDRVREVGEPALSEDSPAREWLADWEALATARLDAVDPSAPPFTEPQRDGRPISDRMERIGVDSCRVPQGLVTAP